VFVDFCGHHSVLGFARLGFPWDWNRSEYLDASLDGRGMSSYSKEALGREAEY